MPEPNPDTTALCTGPSVKAPSVEKRSDALFVQRSSALVVGCMEVRVTEAELELRLREVPRCRRWRVTIDGSMTMTTILVHHYDKYPNTHHAQAA